MVCARTWRSFWTKLIWIDRYELPGQHGPTTVHGVDGGMLGYLDKYFAIRLGQGKSSEEELLMDQLQEGKGIIQLTSG